jgi:hypothetical protein
MKMREKFINGKEAIAKSEVDMSKEAINKSLEKVYDMMIDIHKEFVENVANELYCDFFDRAEPEYIPQFGDKIYASLMQEHEGHPMFTPVEVKDILPTGLVTFYDPKDNQKIHRLFADELMNYRENKVNKIDTRM